MNGQIDIIQYLERIPDDRVAGRRKLITELKERRDQMEAQAQAAQMMASQPEAPAEEPQEMPMPDNAPEMETGYPQLQRAMNALAEQQ